VGRTRIREVKDEIRVLGVDDGRFKPRSSKHVDLIGVVFRGGMWLEGVLRSRIEVDGMDATDRIIEMVKSSPHYGQLRVIMLSGITFGGFNVVDVRRLYEETGLPVIVVSERMPDMDRIREALKNLPEWEERWRLIRGAGEMFEVEVVEGSKPIYVQAVGIPKEKAVEVVRKTCVRGRVPEPIRVAHLISSAISEAS